MLLESERPRWVIKEQAKAASPLRRALSLLGSFLGALVLFAVLVILTFFLSTSDTWLIVLALVLVGSVVGMEVYLARNMAVAKAAMTMKEWAAKEKEKNADAADDDDDDGGATFEFEMVTVNPVARLASTSGAAAQSEPAKEKDSTEV
jgi:hypothetical protein